MEEWPAVVRRVFIFFFILSPFLAADEVDNLLHQVDSAMAEGRYTQAIALLEQGKARWPEDYRPPMRAGDLYAEKELYRLALAEYKAAEKLQPNQSDLLFSLSAVHTYLGSNDAAVEVLERLLKQVDEEDLLSAVVDSLGWMYFKTYRMDEGIALMESFLNERFERHWAHTLGALYAGKYKLESSRHWYERSIEDALASGEEGFASTAHYNLAILEMAFYQYTDARSEAWRSLELMSRAGPHLILGNLDFLAWDLNSTMEHYRTAGEWDTTPLTRVDQAAFFQRVGRLDEAIRFIEDVQQEDEAWMHRFGLDRVRFGMDLHRILADSWRGKAEVDSLTPRAGIRDRLAAFGRRLIWKSKGLFHERHHRSLTMGYAKRLKAEGNELDASWNAYLATRGYGRAALRFLAEAREQEVSLIPEALPWYLLEEGEERKKVGTVKMAMDGFSDEERDPYERALRVLSDRAGRRLPQNTAREVLWELYRMNPGGLRQYGLSLPIRVDVGGDRLRRVRRTMLRMLRSAGHPINRGSGWGMLTLTVLPAGEDELVLRLLDSSGEIRGSVNLAQTSNRRSIAMGLAALLDQVYTTKWEGGSLHQ